MKTDPKLEATYYRLEDMAEVMIAGGNPEVAESIEIDLKKALLEIPKGAPRPDKATFPYLSEAIKRFTTRP